MKKYLLSILGIACLGLASCSDDKEYYEPAMPDNSIALNMMNQSNGKTMLGESDVYINDANNFTSAQCGISDLGSRGSLDANPNLTQVAREIAVTPGNYYQVFITDDIREVAGQRAIPVDCTYYNFLTESWINDKDGNHTGAKVIYTECKPDTDLPAWNEVVASMEVQLYKAVEHIFEKDVKIDDNYQIYSENGNTDALEVRIENNKVTFISKKYSYDDYDVQLYLRSGCVYTRVYFHIFCRS